MESPPVTKSAPTLNGSWSIYTSLLKGLPGASQKALEDACRASYLGHFKEADDRFDALQAETAVIVVLQHADMLSTSGRERDRVELLRRATGRAVEDSDARAVRLLLELMLAEAELFALGQLPTQPNLLARMRAHFRSRSPPSPLSDIEVRCVTAYYALVKTLEEQTNLITRTDETIFGPRTGDKTFASKEDETKALRKALQEQQRWSQATVMMRLQLSNTKPGLELRDAVNDALSLCRAAQAATTHPAVQFRVVTLKRMVADRVSSMMPPWAASLRQECVQMLSEHASPGRWQNYCPAVASSMAMLQVRESGESCDVKIRKLEGLAKESEGRRDYLIANQLYMATRDVAQEWMKTAEADDSAAQALGQLRTRQLAYIRFHREKTQSAYFQAAGLAHYLSTLTVRYHDNTEIFHLVNEHDSEWLNFTLPISQERIYDLGIKAARDLGLKEEQRRFERKHLEWVRQCPFASPSGNVTASAILRSDYAARRIQSTDNDMIQWGVNAVHVILDWIAYEWDTRLLSSNTVRLLLGRAVQDLPSDDISDYLANQETRVRIVNDLYGTNELTPTALFLEKYRRLLSWAKLGNSERLPDLSSRLFAVKIILRSRTRMVGDYLVDHQHDVATRAGYVLECEELAALEILEGEANNNMPEASTAATMNIIHALLTKSMAPRVREMSKITDADFEQRMDDCRHIVDAYKSRGKKLQQYHALVQLVRLAWQRYIHFSAPSGDIFILLEEADQLFNETRKLIQLSSPSADLVARAKLSHEFMYREHCDYALAASYALFTASLVRYGQESTPGRLGETEQQYRRFINWTLRSKGRGFADVLGMETSVIQAAGRAVMVPAPPPNSGIGPSDTLVTQTEGLVLGNPPASKNVFKERTISEEQLDEMLYSLPEKVAIVDFVDLKHSGQSTGNFALVIHRKGQPPLTRIVPGFGIRLVDKWVESNLDLGKDEDGREINPLNYGDSTQKLGELTALVNTIAEFVPAGQTVILCPTTSLHRVPIHAIPFEKKPFIERNPIAYCQSLTVLHWLWTKSTAGPAREQPVVLPPKSIVLNPLPDQDEFGPVESKSQVQGLARRLGSEYHGTWNSQRLSVLPLVEDCSLFHYHGHVEHNPLSGLDSIMCLNEVAYKNPFVDLPGAEALTARDFFGVRLRERALATIVACGSGRASITGPDDVLGFPTALFYAGAGTVVSTLWSIDDRDGAAFGDAFYSALAKQKQQPRDRGHHPPSADSNLEQFLDVALAMQEAVKTLRGEVLGDHNQTPYHWAAFTINGLHILPSNTIPNRVMEARG